MEKLPTLRREVSKALTNATRDPSSGKRTCVLSDELAKVFIRNQATDELLADVALMCNEFGILVYRRAVSKYKASHQYQAVELSVDELFAHLDGKKEEDEKQDLEQDVDDFANDFPEDDREWLKAHLRDTYGIESAEDWLHLLQARRCTAERNPDLMGQMGRKVARQLSKKAHVLYETAKANDCSPAEWLEWIDTKALIRAGKVNPGSIINVPGGGQIWGDGEAVRPDTNGQPRRKAVDIFGNEVASNEVPDVASIDKMVRKAYKRN